MNKNSYALFFKVFILTFLFSGFVSAQVSLVKNWDYRYGGTDNEKIYSFLKTADNGYLLGGYTVSDSGCDISQHTKGGYDFLIIKLNSYGIKEWDKRYGGDQADILSSIILTDDGGYLLAGSSLSGISGDKTQSCQGSGDYWILKIDSSGNKLWDKRFGGIYDDALISVCKSADGGFLLGGQSNSPAGGDKTDSSITAFTFDFWIIKIDASGNKIWDKVYGGNNNESLSQIDRTTDNGYLLAGFSISDSSGSKSEMSQGGYDYWVLKIDSVGNKEWDKTYGGNLDDQLMSFVRESNNGFVLAGFSYSAATGNKSQPSKGLSDYWIIKIDANGNKIWDKDFGGTNTDDDMGNIIKTADGGYIIPTTSYSNSGGDKSENNMGIEQTWLVKMDVNGNKIWDKTIFTNGHDEGCLIIENNEHCFTLANRCNAGIGGYKSQPNWDAAPQPLTTYDYWIVSFCDTATTTSVTENHSENFVYVFPNPFANKITVGLKDTFTDFSIAVCDITGRSILNSTIKNQNSNLVNLDLSFLPIGIYVIHIQTNSQKYVQRIIKEN